MPAQLIPGVLERFAPEQDVEDDGREQGRNVALAARRPKLWELGDKYHCPVVGTCLPIAELRRLVRREGAIAATTSDFDAHVTAVRYCKNRNPLSASLQKVLERRHALWVAHFGKAKTEEAAAALWNEALAAGAAAGALWGALTCRAATPELKQAAYEDIHMLSHQAGAGVRADLRRVVATEGELVELRGKLARTENRHEAELAVRAARILALEQSLETARATADEVQQLKRRIVELSTGQRLAELEWRLAQSEHRAAHLERQGLRLEALQDTVTQLESENGRLAQMLGHAEAERHALENCVVGPNEHETETTCARPDFAGRRVLCVGGRLNLFAQYRLLVERAGGALEIHDGGREEALSRLPHLLERADAVICPADCVGHPAYYALKRHCKITGKPCVLLRNSGLASFAEGLQRLADGHVEIGLQ